MSCKCKNIIENWQGGTVPLGTTFLNWVNFSGQTQFAGDVLLVNMCQTENGTKKLRDMLTRGAHPSPVDSNDIYCIYTNHQVIHADEWIVEGTINLDGEAGIMGTDVILS